MPALLYGKSGERQLLAALEQVVIPAIEQLYAQIGYLGVLVAMAIESACIPLPSEIIMPLAGWMVYRGVFDIWLASIAGTLGCTVGSTVAYWLSLIHISEPTRLGMISYAVF